MRNFSSFQYHRTSFVSHTTNGEWLFMKISHLFCTFVAFSTLRNHTSPPLCPLAQVLTLKASSSFLNLPFRFVSLFVNTRDISSVVFFFVFFFLGGGWIFFASFCRKKIFFLSVSYSFVALRFGSRGGCEKNFERRNFSKNLQMREIRPRFFFSNSAPRDVI